MGVVSIGIVVVIRKGLVGKKQGTGNVKDRRVHEKGTRVSRGGDGGRRGVAQEVPAIPAGRVRPSQLLGETEGKARKGIWNNRIMSNFETSQRLV